MINTNRIVLPILLGLSLCACSSWAYADFSLSNAPPSNASSAGARSPVAAVSNDATPEVSAPEAAIADTSGEDLLPQGWQITGLLGIADLNTTFGDQVVKNGPSSSFANTLTGPTDSAAFAPGLGVAYNFLMAPYTRFGDSYLLQSMSLGVNAYFLGASSNGLVNYSSVPEFQDSAYNANVNSFRIMLDAEFNFHPIWRLLPFAQVGIGDAVNWLTYSESTVPGEFSLPLVSVNGSSNNFAYEVGGGGGEASYQRAFYFLSALFVF